MRHDVAAAKHHTDTEEALEEVVGVHPTRHYSLRADQLDDGSYRYALEDPDSGETLAEGVHADDGEARRLFRENLALSGLSEDEIKALGDGVAHQQTTVPAP
jgi:hypothetical protein